MILSKKFLVSWVLLWAFWVGFFALQQAQAFEAKNVRLVGYSDLQEREALFLLKRRRRWTN